MESIRFVRGSLSAACLLLTALPGAHADPVSFEDLLGNTITLDAPAERIVVMPVPYASTVIAVDAGTDKLVAMHPQSKLAIEEGILDTFFPAAMDIPSDIVAGGASRGFAPNVETIAALNPDLIIQWGDLQDDVIGPLTNAGMNVAQILYGTEDYARETLTMISTAMGRTEKLETLMQWRDDTAATIAEGLAGLDDAERPRVINFFYTTPELQTTGAGTYMDWQINLVGGVNAAAEISSWGPVGIEQVAAWDPEVILLGSFERDVSVDRIYDDPILGVTSAAKNHRVYKVPVGGYRWDPPSQDSPLMWMWLASLLHPDRFDFDVRAATVEWYQKIYGHAPTPEQMDVILHMEMNGDAANYDQFARN